MPELPEVERAARLTHHVAAGRKIDKVETFEDTIVYTGGITHHDFAKEITGRTVLNVGRYGKVFYIELDGPGRMPILHLGMTGMVQVKGEEPTWYRRRNKDLSADVWPPPRFLKFIIHFSALDNQPATQLAFIDARRLGRIRLAREPLKEHPISELGFDPILSMPELKDFKAMVLKRTCPVKALLLDQSFSAGVGNWVADEILFQSQIHPEQRASTLTDSQLQTMYDQTKSVCETAVAVNADSSQFPKHWLFQYRWGKGEKNKTDMILPNGEKAKIKWLTVGGRTSAVVEQMQKMPAGGRDKSKKAHAEQDNDGEDQDNKPGGSKAPTQTRKRKATRGAEQANDPSVDDGDSSAEEIEAKPVKRTRRTVMQAEQKATRKGSRGQASVAATSTRATRSSTVVDNEPAKKAGRGNKRSTRK
ncbi:formamidopyrimidine-DNA glycosylase [Rhizoctonia solani]|uniref:Formamidopyrimidine-DNA glycosylase n=1 Tax=Rhizoctonia solani TaxID=456999 RepID=A0A0K6GIQ8_9AGAM|nr:formamidopyrimidine-DNA glycosylase [Rhizoctonia solani]